MAREMDEAWIEEAVDRYRRIEQLQVELDKAMCTMEVTVRSSDGSVEVVVTPAGQITDVRLHGSLQHRTNADLSRAVHSAVTAADEAARWARQKLHAEAFGDYRPLRES